MSRVVVLRLPLLDRGHRRERHVIAPGGATILLTHPPRGAPRAPRSGARTELGRRSSR
jgi:hypothetical protein